MACGGDSKDADSGDNTPAVTAKLDAYISDLQDLLTQSRTDAVDVERSLTDQLDAAETVDDAKAILGQGVDDFEVVARRFRDALGDLDPPDAVRSQHEEILVTYDEAIDAFDQIRDDLDAVETETDLIELSGSIGSQFADLTERTRTACAQLQTIAFDDGLSITLDC